MASALGRKRDEENQDLYALHMGVRVDQSGESLEDFQMVHGIKQADLTRRFYLSDAVFLVGLEHPDQAFLEKIQLALENPAYPLFLGLRSCPPSFPLVLGIRKTCLKETLQEEPWLAAEWRQKRLDQHLRLILEDDGEPFEEKMDRLTSELSEMFEKSHELENEIRNKLGAIGYEI